MLVAAGSFHELDAVSATSPAQIRNRAHLLNRKGAPVFAHDKLRRFGPVHAGEEIAEGNAITLLISDFGVISLAICKDFNDVAASGFAAIWKLLGLDVLLVPAMGNASSLSAHLRAAKDLWINSKALTLVANQEIPGEAVCPGFVGANTVTDGKSGGNLFVISLQDRYKSVT